MDDLSEFGVAVHWVNTFYSKFIPHLIWISSYCYNCVISIRLILRLQNGYFSVILASMPFSAFIVCGLFMLSDSVLACIWCKTAEIPFPVGPLKIGFRERVLNEVVSDERSIYMCGSWRSISIGSSLSGSSVWNIIRAQHVRVGRTLICNSIYISTAEQLVNISTRLHVTVKILSAIENSHHDWSGKTAIMTEVVKIQEHRL